jgi:DNA-binding NtrC family response regulator
MAVATTGSWKMFVTAHSAPRRRTRPAPDRVLVVAPEANVRRWIEHELFGEPVTAHVVDSLAEVVTCLTFASSHWSNIVIVDASAITATELDLLAAMRDAGWQGTIMAVGTPAGDMHELDVVIASRAPESLRYAVKRQLHSRSGGR